MALIPLKGRAGIAALTFAAAVVPFVLATPAKEINIGFLDASDSVFVQVTEDGAPTRQFFNGRETVITRFFTSFPSTVAPGSGGIVFLEPGTNIISDILQVRIAASFFLTRETFFTFDSDPVLPIATTGFPRIEEDGTLQEVGTVVTLPSGGQEDRQFRDSLGNVVSLPFDIGVFVQSDLEVPGPVVGAGLPGLVAACGALLALARRRRRTV